MKMNRSNRCGTRTATAGWTFAATLLLSFAAAGQKTAHVAQQQAMPTADSVGDSLLQQAQDDVDAKDFAAAAEKYKIYLTAHPDDAQIHFQLGYCETALNQVDTARSEYQRATELDPTLAPAFLNLGLTLLDRAPTDAVAPLRRAAELMPGEERPQMLLATALARSGHTDDALAAFAEAEKLDSSDAQLHIAYGEALRKTNHPADAEKEFRAAIAANPNEKAAYLKLAQCLFAEKKYDEAAASAADYMKFDPDNHDAHSVRGQAFAALGRYDEAAVEFKESGANASDGATLMMEQYNALMDAKKYDDAYAVLLKAESLDPQNAQIHGALGKIYLQRKSYPQAAQEFQTDLKFAPDDTDALAGLAGAAYLAKDYPDTLTTLDVLAQKKPLTIADLYVRADCYDKIGKKPEALDAYEKFLAANTDHNSDMYFAASERVRGLKRELGKK